ncbi:MAG TPA: porin family protein [Flavisolibacter sp.]
MKTKLLFLFAVLFTAQAALAQFNIGGKVGANIMKVDGKAFRDEFRYGYHLGGFMEIGLGKKWSIMPEVVFNQYQTRADSSFKNVYENAVNFSNYQDVKLNYLSIPLVLNYKLGNVLSLQAGPQYGILLDQSKNLVENGRDAFKSGDFSLIGGAQIRVSKIRLTGRYVVGLTNINDISDQEKWKNQGYQLSVGFAL